MTITVLTQFDFLTNRLFFLIQSYLLFILVLFDRLFLCLLGFFICLYGVLICTRLSSHYNLSRRKKVLNIQNIHLTSLRAFKLFGGGGGGGGAYFGQEAAF